jgi:hypothetical protein
MSDKLILGDEVLERIYELMYNDIKKIPNEYKRWKIHATYHRIWHLLIDQEKQTPQVGEEEIENMKFYRKNGYSYHDLAYIFRRSPASVHYHLRDQRFEEYIDQLIAEK